MSPDHYASIGVGAKLRNAAGKQGTKFNYETYNHMMDAVYAVDGGMEDWAYAAGWENELGLLGINFNNPVRCGISKG